MQKTIFKLIKLLSKKEREKGFIVIILTLLMGVIEALGAASIMPFLSLASNPEVVEESRVLGLIRKLSGINDYSNFLFFIGFCVFIIIVFSLLIKTITYYVQIKFSVLREYSIGKRLLKLYLSQPYDWFLKKNSSDITKNILSETHDVIASALLPLTYLISSSIVFLSMFLLMFLVNTKIALIACLSFLICYLVIYFAFKKILMDLGKNRFNANKKRFKTVNEVFGAIKQVKLSNLEDKYVERFSTPALELAKDTAYSKLIGTLPRFGLEMIAFGGMFLVILFLLKIYGDISNALPLLGVFAFAGYRILPSLNIIYQSITSLRYSSVAVDNLYSDYMNLKREKIRPLKKSDKINIQNSLELRSINFKYPNTNKNTLEDINIEISKNSITAFIGFTGSGKTTILDIILGLLKPQKGQLLIDNKPLLLKEISSWQNSLGYVPQNIFLTDESVASNIAFGLDKDEQDIEKIKKVAKIAQIDQFIMNELPFNYDTFVGERGVRLSGGQMQRIGIARALYNDPKILILDEATSALDNITENKVMNSLLKLNADLTIIMIAHRLTTVEKCNKIYLIDKGKIIASGKYEEIYKKSALFRKMNRKQSK